MVELVQCVRRRPDSAIDVAASAFFFVHEIDA
jgi:hypothetical protein